MLELLRKLYPLRLAPVSEDTDAAVRMLQSELSGGTVHEFVSGSEHNGWIVPASWKAVRAEIRQKGRLLYNGLLHPLGVVGYSESYKGSVDLPTLKQHVFVHPTLPDALVYYPFYYYQPWKRDWALSIPESVLQTFRDGTYDINIETSFTQGTMKVFDFVLPGKTKRTIVLNAHNCHAGQANDDVAGIVVGAEVMKRLAVERERLYTYRFIVGPEHFGTVFLLATLPRREIADMTFAIFLEMLGNDNSLALQESFSGTTELDVTAHHYLRHHFPDYRSGAFREIVGNDEVVWEAPGYEIPCISLSRAPFPEYHSDRDDDSIIDIARLEEAVSAVLGILKIIETNTRLIRHFDGLVALSNPKYDLYISPGAPVLPPGTVVDRRWNAIMNYLPRYFDGHTTILQIAEKHQVDFFALYRYLQKFQAKGLVSFTDSMAK